MDAGIIMVSPGPNIADPTDVIKIIVRDKEGDARYFSAPSDWRGWYIRFIIWALRRYVRRIK